MLSAVSAGAAQSLLLLDYPDKFAWVGSFSPGFDMYNTKWGTPEMPPSANGQRALVPADRFPALFPNLDAKANSQFRLIYIACGTNDDHLNVTRQFHEWLDSKKIKIICVEGQGDTHSYSFWRPQLTTFAAMLFKPVVNNKGLIRDLSGQVRIMGRCKTETFMPRFGE